MTAWLTFQPRAVPGRMTSTIDVVGVRGVQLGVIQWHSRWRCYAFFPVPATLYDADCLQQIAQEITRLMALRRPETVP